MIWKLLAEGCAVEVRRRGGALVSIVDG